MEGEKEMPVEGAKKKAHEQGTRLFSSFNDADPSHIMLVDCCMLYCHVTGHHGRFHRSQFTPFLLILSTVWAGV